MKESFTLSRTQVVANDHALRRKILQHTGSEDAVVSILRTLERLIADRAAGRFEMTPVEPKRVAVGGPSVLWSVRAVRL